MPAIAFSPLAWTAIRLGAVAAVALYASRGRVSDPKDPHQEAVLDDLPDGLRARPHRAEAEQGVHGHGRFRRVVRLRSGGPSVEIDAAALARLRFRRVS